MSMRWTLAGLLAVGVLAASCTSSPDPADAAFLARLGEPADTAQVGDLTVAGRAVCERIRPVADLNGFTAAQTSLRADFGAVVDRYGILAFEDAATSAYCPDVAAGLQAKLQPRIDAAARANAEAARRADEMLRSRAPAAPAPTTKRAAPTKCVGYECSEEQDVELNRREREANSSEGDRPSKAECDAIANGSSLSNAELAPMLRSMGCDETADGL